MNLETQLRIEDAYYEFVDNKGFPCVAAKAALAKGQVQTIACDHIACPKDDWAITNFINDFVDEYRACGKLYTSAVVIFEGPSMCTEEYFDQMMWQRLQAIADLDSKKYTWNKQVSNDPSSPHFSFSVKEEAFYIIGLHPGSNRKARQFQYPAIVFNPHDQFETLRKIGKYSVMKETVRKRDSVFSGSVNPMLADFGQASEVYQYSGRVYDDNWKCPFISNHGKN